MRAKSLPVVVLPFRPLSAANENAAPQPPATEQKVAAA
jgi:hypothetical protein